MEVGVLIAYFPRYHGHYCESILLSINSFGSWMSLEVKTHILCLSVQVKIPWGMRAPQHQRLKVLPPHREVIPAPYFIFFCTACSKAITQLSSRQHGHQAFPEGCWTSHPALEKPVRLCRNSTSGQPLEPGTSKKGAIMAKGCKSRKAGQIPSSNAVPALTLTFPHWGPRRKRCGCSQLVHKRGPTKAMTPHRSHSLCC